MLMLPPSISTVLSKWEAIWPVTNQTRVITYGCQYVHSVLAVTFLPACLSAEIQCGNIATIWLDAAL